MCNRRSMRYPMTDLEYYYTAQYAEEVDGMTDGDGNWEPAYHINAFDHSPAPILTSRDPQKIRLFRWGLIPHRTRSMEDALKMRQQTLMARTEDMYEKYSYAELAKAGKRCLIPTSGYFEHRWLDEKGRTKIPYLIFLKDRPIFSIGGLYSKWIDPKTGKVFFTYTVCTTRANELTGMIHNTGLRMPVVLPTRETERAWLDPTLKQHDVMELCEPISADLMDAYTVSRIITGKNGNVPQAVEPYAYPEPGNATLFG